MTPSGHLALTKDRNDHQPFYFLKCVGNLCFLGSPCTAQETNPSSYLHADTLTCESYSYSSSWPRLKIAQESTKDDRLMWQGLCHLQGPSTSSASQFSQFILWPQKGHSDEDDPPNKSGHVLLSNVPNWAQAKLSVLKSMLSTFF